jgi:hypothetical protein
MAIKGKRRTRHRSSRSAARAPRPFLVRPKTPLFRRTGTTVVLVVLAEAVVFVFLALAGAQTEADERRDRITEFGSLVEAQLYREGAAQQSFAGPVVLPQLSQAVAELASGEVKDPEAMSIDAEGWAKVAREAGDGLGRIATESEVLVEARNLMEQGLLLYSALAREVRVAAELDGTQQQQLLETLAGQMSVAATIFDTGWGKLQEARLEAGLEIQAPPAGGLGGLPGGLPGGIPGGIPGLPAPQDPVSELAP